MSYQSVQVYNTFFALLSLLALGAAVGLTGYRVVKGREEARALGQGWALWAAWAVAAVATAGSLGYSEILDFPPCRLCWFQRIAMYPMAVILLVGAVRKDAQARLYALPFAVIGFGISAWHYLIQTFPSLEGAGGACDPTVLCSAKLVNTFGFVSIPFMAGAGFLLIAVLLTFCVGAAVREGAQTTSDHVVLQSSP